MTKHVTLDDHAANVIEQQIKLGRFATEAQVVSYALELLEREGAEMLEDAEDIRRLVQEGIDSGPGIPAEEVFGKLKARFEGMLTEQERDEVRRLRAQR